MTRNDVEGLREQLDAQALAGAHWPELLGELARAARGRVRLAAADAALLCAADPGGALPLPGAERFDADRPHVMTPDAVAAAFASAGPVDVCCLDGVAMRGLALAWGERRVGVLLVEATCSGSDALLRAASTAVAIVAVRRDAQASAVAETAAWFVDELRFGSARTEQELDAVAGRFGVRLDEEYTPVVIDYDGTDLRMFETALAWLESPVRRDGNRAWTLLGPDASGRLALVQRRLQEFVNAGTVCAAAGPTVRGAHAAQRAFQQAQFALRMLRRDGGVAAPLITFGELGTAGLLAQVPRDELAAFVSAHLGPIEAHPELVHTLRAWFSYGGSWRQVAEAVHIHRNSVGHRMQRLRALLGVELADPQAALDLQLALVAHDVLAALSDPDR